MVVCVKCCDSITRAKAEENGWRRVDGAWHCPKDLVGVEEKKKSEDGKGGKKKDGRRRRKLKRRN